MNIKLKLFLYAILISVSSLSFAQVESDPPTLTSFSMDKTSIDVGESNQIVRFTVEAEDESGVDWSNPDTKMEFNDPTGKSYYINFSVEAPHVAQYVFNCESKIGLWVVGEVRLFDTLGNGISYYGKIGELGESTSVEVIGGVESAPPILTSFSINPVNVDVSEADQIVTFTVEAEDDTGVDWSNPDTKIEFNSPSSTSFYMKFSADAPHVAKYVFNCESKIGLWVVGEVRLFDTLGNGISYYGKIGELGESTSVDIGGLDTDSDGIDDCNDSFPLDSTESEDSDLDGVGDNSDPFPENPLYSMDTDSDGMPDSWETKYGLDPNDPSDATSDTDNDGVFAVDEFLAGTIPSGSLDIDGNGQYDALTDGLLLLRGMFGLDGSALITGTVASDAIFTASVAIENRIKILGDLSDIDGNGITDALTDGLLTLRYLFGLEGDTLIKGVVAGGATRTSAEEIETYLAMLMPSIKSTNESNPPELSDLSISTTSVDVSSSSQDITFSLKVKDESGVTYYPGAGEAAIYPSGFSADQMSAVNDWVLKSGDNKDGVWEITITVPQGQLSGNYYFSTGSFRDANGSSSACNSNGSYCGGPYPLIAVDNGLEANPPELSDLTISTTSVDVSSSSQDITFSLKVKDESGVTYYPGAGEAAIYPSGFSADQMSAVNDWVLKSGDNKDGVWEITITVPQGQLSGNYYFSTGSFRDANGSSSACNSNGSYCGGPYPLIVISS